MMHRRHDDITGDTAAGIGAGDCRCQWSGCRCLWRRRACGNADDGRTCRDEYRRRARHDHYPDTCGSRDNGRTRRNKRRGNPRNDSDRKWRIGPGGNDCFRLNRSRVSCTRRAYRTDGQPSHHDDAHRLEGQSDDCSPACQPALEWQGRPRKYRFPRPPDRYQKEHPGVTLEWVRVPGSSFDELTEWVKTRLASKNVPTISAHFFNTTTAQEASNTSPWIAMTPYLDKVSPYTMKPWRQDFPEDTIAYMQSSLKQLYYVTLTAYKAAWLYNKKMWNKAGLTEADEPKTWVDFFKVLEKLKASGVIPIARAGDAFALSHAYNLLANSLGRKDWLAMSGGQIFADDQTKYAALCSGKWKMDTPWNRKAAEVTKQLFQYWPPGSTTLKASDIEQLWLSQKAVLWQGTPGNQGQTILKRLDEAKGEGLETFEVGAFPTPQPDAETFGADLAMNAAPIADDGERGLAYNVAVPDIRSDKDPGTEAIAIDLLQWFTSPEIQAIYVKPSYDLPVNPNVKLEDPRLALFYKNKNQLFPAYFYYGNRPDWIPNYQGYLLGQKDLMATSRMSRRKSPPMRKIPFARRS